MTIPAPLRRFFCASGLALSMLCSGSATAHAGDLVTIALSYVDARNPTGFRGPWCAAFVNLVLRQAGYAPSASRRARDAARLGPRLQRATRGSLVITRHHVEIASGEGWSISGNWGGRVAIHPTHLGLVIQPTR